MTKTPVCNSIAPFTHAALPSNVPAFVPEQGLCVKGARTDFPEMCSSNFTAQDCNALGRTTVTLSKGQVITQKTTPMTYLITVYQVNDHHGVVAGDHHIAIGPYFEQQQPLYKSRGPCVELHAVIVSFSPFRSIHPEKLHSGALSASADVKPM